MCHVSSKPVRLSINSLLVIAALVLGWSAAEARAQNAFLANNVVTAQDATIFRSQINDYVTAEVGQLKSSDPAVQKAAKDDMISKVQPTPANQPSASFLGEYADELNQQLAPLAKDKSLRVKLNAAVVNAAVAQQANNARQVDSTLAFIQDPEEPIVLWGLKAATYEIPALIEIPAAVRNDKLTSAVLPAVKAHPESGPIVEEAYKALTLDTTGNNFVNLTAQQLQDCVGPVLDLFGYRVGLYGAKAPEDPLAESFGTLFLTRDKVWGAEVAKQQRSTLDTMYKLCEASGNLELNADPQKDDLITLLRQTGRAFYVIGTILNDNKITADGTAVSQINANTVGPTVQQALQSLKTDLGNVQLSSGAVSNGTSPPPGNTASNGGGAQ